MATYAIQDDTGVLDIESLLLIEQIKRSRLHEYFRIKLEDIKVKDIDERAIPVGTIEFVTAYLNRTVRFRHQYPIEIPKYLRTDEFLKRDYNIIIGKDIPTSGHCFIKDVETLKYFSYLGNMEHFINKDIFEEAVDKGDDSIRLKEYGLYQLSSDFKPESEYRAYVFCGELIACINYNGDPFLLPDMNLLKKAMMLIGYNEKWLKSYTIDLMVRRVATGIEETALIEIHNFTGCGLYTTLPTSALPYAYKDGIDYLINDNRRIEI